MRRKQGRLKPGGLYFNPTRSDANTTDRDLNTGDNKDTNTRDNKDSNVTNKDAEERDTNAANKDASSLVNVIGGEKISSSKDPPQEMGKTRSMKKTHSAENKQDILVEGRERDSSKTEETGLHPANEVLPSEDPDSLPQVCLGSIHSLIGPSVGPSVLPFHP